MIPLFQFMKSDYDTNPTLATHWDMGTGSYGPRREKTCLRRFVNNTGAEQPAHPHSLISAFVINYLESIICNLATGKISIF